MGHWCWCCDQVVANESFSGRGHAMHLCKACSRLGPEERAIRQLQRNVDRAALRGRRGELAGFLRHEDERVWRRAATWLSALGGPDAWEEEPPS